MRNRVAHTAGLTIAVTAAVLTLLLAGCGGSSATSSAATERASPPPAVGAGAAVSIGSSGISRPVPPGFVGLSIEFRTLDSYAGTDPTAVNPVFVALMRNLAPGQDGELRIGGDTTDWTWYPIAHMRRPLGVRYDLTGRWFAVARAVSEALSAHVIVGINLEANNPRLSAAEARAVLAGFGRQRVEGLEIGNEPELYGSFAWFQLHGRKYYGRPHAYNFDGFLHDYAGIAHGLPRAPLAGPNTGSPAWMPFLARFLRAEPRVAVATLHRYPLKRCSKSAHVTLGQLLTSESSRGLADSVARYAQVAHAARIPLRIDEMNSVSCGGQPGVSDTFAAALWSLDAMFEMARVGVDGVNIHSRPGVTNELFTFTHSNGVWRAGVNPVYYGLMMFAQAAPPGSRLLRISGAGSSGLQIWATAAPDGRTRVVLINKSSARGRTVALRIPGATAAGQLVRLEAPSLAARHGVRFGGRSFGSRTSTGVLAAPQPQAVPPGGKGYVVKVPAASAALLTLTRG